VHTPVLMENTLGGLTDRLYWRKARAEWHCFERLDQARGYVSLCGRREITFVHGRQIARPEARLRCNVCDELEIARRGWDRSGPASSRRAVRSPVDDVRRCSNETSGARSQNSRHDEAGGQSPVPTTLHGRFFDQPASTPPASLVIVSLDSRIFVVLIIGHPKRTLEAHLHGSLTMNYGLRSSLMASGAGNWASSERAQRRPTPGPIRSSEG
jgi:hypothetical protein